MTKAQAWKRFAADGLCVQCVATPRGAEWRAMAFGQRDEQNYLPEGWSVVEAGSDWAPEPDVRIGTGPTPEAAIAAAFGETLED